jgi:hypothetical protein
MPNMNTGELTSYIHHNIYGVQKMWDHRFSLYGIMCRLNIAEKYKVKWKEDELKKKIF